MGSWMQREISFSHNGQAILATFVDNPPAGGWTSEEICFICKHPLGNHPFYTTDPLVVYFHAHCFCTAVAGSFQSRSLDNRESSHIPYFLSAPPSNASHPSYSKSYPYQTYTYPSNYPTYQPPPNYYHNQLYQNYHPHPHSSPYQASNYPTNYQPPPNYYYNQSYQNYHPHPHSSPYQAPNYPTYQPPPNYYYNQSYQNYPHPNNYGPPLHHHSSSSSSFSVPGLTGIVATTVLESLIQSFFSSWFSNY